MIFSEVLCPLVGLIGLGMLVAGTWPRKRNRLKAPDKACKRSGVEAVTK